MTDRLDVHDPLHDDAAPRSLGRRGFLKILAGVPIAIGLPAAFFLRAGADEGGDDAPRSDAAGIARALAEAGSRGWLAVLVAVPAAPAGCDPSVVAARESIATALTELVETPDDDAQLGLAQTVIIAATFDALRAAVPALGGDAAAGASGVFLYDPASSARASASGPRKLDIDLCGGTSEPGARLAAAILEEVMGKGRARLRSRAVRELESLDEGERRIVDAALAQLASGSEAERDAAAEQLAARRDRLRAVLARSALESQDATVRARCSLLARPDGRVEPIGTRWIRAAPQEMPDHDPCPACGMAIMPPRAKDYLKLIAGGSEPD